MEGEKMKEIIYEEIKNMESDHKWKVGDNVVFHTGQCSKEEIELIQLDPERCGIQFHVKDGFEVKREPYTYICKVLEVDRNNKVELVQLVRKLTYFPDETVSVRDMADDYPPIKLFMPFVFPWSKDLSGKQYNFETYVIHSINTDFTPLLGAACLWLYTDKDLREKEKEEGFKMHNGGKE